MKSKTLLALGIGLTLGVLSPWSMAYAGRCKVQCSKRSKRARSLCHRKESAHLESSYWAYKRCWRRARRSCRRRCRSQRTCKSRCLRSSRTRCSQRSRRIRVVAYQRSFICYKGIFRLNRRCLSRCRASIAGGQIHDQIMRQLARNSKKRSRAKRQSN